MIFSNIFIAQFNISTSRSFITTILLINGLGMGFWGSPNMALTYSSPRQKFNWFCFLNN